MTESDRKVTLTRKPSIPDGTFGTWLSDSGFTCEMLELPWADNVPYLSCIPKSTYQVHWDWSPVHNCNLYHIQNVVGRTFVEIHAANVTLQLLGCMAPGLSIVTFPKGAVLSRHPPFLILEQSRMGVSSSQEALQQLEADLRDEDGNQQDFTLTIT